MLRCNLAVSNLRKGMESEHGTGGAENLLHRLSNLDGCEMNWTV
jgi:hypothetical protein